MLPPPLFKPSQMRVAQGGRRLYIYNKNIVYKFFLKKNENGL